ncbi:MAG: rRNA maturation RNase YbeY [Bacteroidales bacterium]|nr:rRNA maturation RNase YbeY [Bacteroidales bacterium]
MPVYFHWEDVSFDLPQRDKLSKWILEVLKSHNAVCENINIIFTSNPYLLKINRDYLKHNYFTDVITFDFSDKYQVSGDVFISVEQVRINSNDLNISFYNELYRVIIHGVLHLLGFDDNSLVKKDEMTGMEDRALKILENISDERNI